MGGNTIETFDLHEFLATDFPSGNAIIQDILYTGENSLLMAPQKAGKTMLGLQAASAAAAGTTFANMWDVYRPHKVLYLSLEGSGAEIQAIIRRQLALMPHPPEAGMLTIVRAPHLHINTAQGWNAFSKLIKEHTPELLVVDPLYKIHKGTLIDDGQVGLTVTRLDEATALSGHATLVLAHQHRMKRDYLGMAIPEGVESYFGSYVLAAWVNNFYRLQFSETTHEGTLYAEVQRTPRFGKEKKLILWDEEESLGFQAIDTTSALANDIEARLADLGGLGYRGIAKALGETHVEEVRRAVKELVSRGIVTVVPGGKGRITTLVARSGA